MTFLGALILAALLVWARGPVLWWDWAQYHHYAGFKGFDGGMAAGLLPAGAQSFFNPLAYVPAYWMEQQGLPAWAVAWALACVHLLNVLAVGWVAGEVFRVQGRWMAGPVGLSMAYALCTPVLIDLLGTSSIDPTTSVGVLCAVAACLRARRTGAWLWMLVAGVGAGVAAGLKLSNAVAALVVPLVFFWPAYGRPGALANVSIKQRLWRPIQGGLAYALGGLLGFVSVHGVWSVELFRLTGNPIYPFLHHVWTRATPVVAADHAPQVPVWDVLLAMGGGRFVPSTWVDVLRFPLDMANPRLDSYRVYVEWHSPDPRLLVVCALGLLALGLGCIRRWRGTGGGAAQGASPVDSARPLWALAVVWGIAWVLSSGNGRYGLPWLMVLSVLVVHAMWTTWSPGWGRRMVVWIVLLVQAGYTWVLSERDSARANLGWANLPLQVSVPAELREAPWLHLTPLAMSWSFLVPSMHPDGLLAALAPLCEGCAGPSDAAGLRPLLARWHGKVRVLVPYDQKKDGQRGWSSAAVRRLDSKLAPYDLRMRTDSCVFFEPYAGFQWPGLDVWVKDYRADGSVLIQPLGALASCLVQDAPGARAAFERERVRYDQEFAQIEQACRAELGLGGGVSSWSGGQAWSRSYSRREVSVTIHNGKIHLEAYGREPEPWTTLAVWRNPATRPDCSAVLAMTRPVARKPFELSDLGGSAWPVE